MYVEKHLPNKKIFKHIMNCTGISVLPAVEFFPQKNHWQHTRSRLIQRKVVNPVSPKPLPIKVRKRKKSRTKQKKKMMARKK